MTAPLHVNVIVPNAGDGFERQEPQDDAVQWTYSAVPVPADLHVVYGVKEKIDFDFFPKNLAFIAVEAPEVDVYDPRVLRNYDFVWAPDYGYLSHLDNYAFIEGHLPWRAGVSIEGVTRPRVNLERADIVRLPLLNNERISILVSQKSFTPAQQARLRFVDYISSKIPVDVFGAGTRPVEDTAEVFQKYGITIAMENAWHRGWWTEKLGDPLLFGNRVLYGGSKSNVIRFGESAVAHLDFTRPQASYRRIQDWLDGLKNDEKSSAERIQAKEFVLHCGNLHHQILRLFAKRSELKKKSRRLSSGDLVSIPPHWDSHRSIQSAIHRVYQMASNARVAARQG